MAAAAAADQPEAAAPIPTTDDLIAVVVDDSPCASPYITAPSSPKHPDSDSSFSTAPPSPTTTHQLTESIRPFDPKPADVDDDDDDDDDFAFEFSTHLLDCTFLYAEELFECGVIRPLKPPPPRLQLCSQLAESTRERTVLARKKFDYEYPLFESAMESSTQKDAEEEEQQQHGMRRRREQIISRHNNNKNHKTSSFRGSSCSSCSSFKSCRKWRFRDLLSFRGSSELTVKKEGDEKSASFGRFSGGSSGSGGRGGSVLDGRFATSGSGKGSGIKKRKCETVSSCKQGFWECMRRFNHGEAHGLVKGNGRTVPSRG